MQLIQFADGYPMAIERVNYFDPEHAELFKGMVPKGGT